MKMDPEKLARNVDNLKKQCEECKLGKKDIGPRSGCEVRKKLVIDQNEVAWKYKHLFFDDKGKCKMFKPAKASIR